MFLLAVFIAIFAATFLVFRAKGQKTADCIHKGLIAGVVGTMLAFVFAIVFSYL